MRNKKVQWEGEMHSLQDCLAMREQELVHTRLDFVKSRCVLLDLSFMVIILQLNMF